MRKILFFCAFCLTHCYNTELVTDHANPLDRIYDDGDFRLVLNFPEKQADGTWLIHWSNVFHKKQGELDDKVFKLSAAGGKLAFKNGAPTASDLEAIKNKSLSHSFTNVLVPISAQKGSYAGSYNLGNLSGLRSYVIYLNYNYTDKDKGTTIPGILHSNVVVFEP